MPMIRAKYNDEKIHFKESTIMNLRLRKDIVAEDINNILVTGGNGVGKTTFLRAALHSSIFYDKLDVGYIIVECKKQGGFEDFASLSFVHIISGQNNANLHQAVDSILASDYQRSVIIIDDWQGSLDEGEKNTSPIIQRFDELGFLTTGDKHEGDQIKPVFNMWVTTDCIATKQDGTWKWSLPWCHKLFDVRVAMSAGETSDCSTPTAVDIQTEHSKTGEVMFAPIKDCMFNIKGNGLLAVTYKEEQAAIWRVPFLPLGKGFKKQRNIQQN
jgi:hypothetical protein